MTQRVAVGLTVLNLVLLVALLTPDPALHGARVLPGLLRGTGFGNRGPPGPKPREPPFRMTCRK